MKRGLLSVLAAALTTLPSAAQDHSAMAVQQSLRTPSLVNVHASVENGIATLTGEVDLYSTKILAEQRVSRIAGIHAIRDEIRVDTPTLSDRELRHRLSQAIAFNTVQCLGHLPEPGQPLSIQVRDGVVTLGGQGVNQPFAAVAVFSAANTKGVKDLIDNIEPKPASSFGCSSVQNNWPDGSTGVSTN